MRRTAWILGACLLATSMPATGASVEKLTLSSVIGKNHGGTLSLYFSGPQDPQERDLRTAVITLSLGDGSSVSCAKGTKGLKLDKWGLVAKFKAPKKLKSRIRSFVLHGAGGSLVAKVGGAPLDLTALPAVDLAFAGHVYHFTPPGHPVDPGGSTPPGGTTPAPFPDGLVAYTTVYRSVAIVPSTPANAVLRSQAELSNYIASMTFSGGVPAALSSIDFSHDTVIVVAGDATGGTIKPWSVRLTGVTAQSGQLLVNYQKLWGAVCCTYLGAPPANTPPFSAFLQFATISGTSPTVSFSVTSVKSQNPWN